MKTIQFQTPAREENAPTVNKSFSHLDLSLGISTSNDTHSCKNAPTTSKRMVSFQPEAVEASPAYKKSVSFSCQSAFDYSYLFSHCPTGFVDPWSLAARQQKAAVEQGHLKANPNFSSSDIAMKPQAAPVAVGWPPVCSSRRNLITQNSTKSSTIYIDEKDSSLKSEMLGETEDGAIRLGLRPTMYVKVNMEGFFVGRKIDLSAHDSYESLSWALQNMFYNFLSNKLITKDGNIDDSEFILLYEDHEGDKILVGDVPWELFLTSVKRLYIARHSSSAQEEASEDMPRIPTKKKQLLN